MLDPRAGLMLEAIGFLKLDAPAEDVPSALIALHRWLDSWAGIVDIERGMVRQGYDLSLTRYANEGWRATFYISGKEHSATSATGSAWQATAWRAVQFAAWGDVEEGGCAIGQSVRPACRAREPSAEAVAPSAAPVTATSPARLGRWPPQEPWHSTTTPSPSRTSSRSAGGRQAFAALRVDALDPSGARRPADEADAKGREHPVAYWVAAGTGAGSSRNCWTVRSSSMRFFSIRIVWLPSLSMTRRFHLALVSRGKSVCAM